MLDPTTNNLGTVAITRTASLLTADVSYGQNLNNAGLKGIDRIWTVAPAAQPSAAVRLTLSWLPGYDNVFSGYRSGQATTTGSYNLFAGPLSG